MSGLERILKNKGNLYVMDLSWHLYRSFYSHKDMHIDIDGYHRPTGHIYGVLSTLRVIRNTDPGCVIVICQDGEPVEREKIMAESGSVGYKEGRPELEFNFYKDVPLIKALACLLPDVYWAYDADKESDDAQYSLAKEAITIEGWNNRVFVYSGDNDLLQTIDDRISVIRHRGPEWWEEINEEVLTTDEKLVKKFHGVDSYHLVNFRAICGDSSDKIKGIPRFPRDIAAAVAMSTDNLAEGHNFTPTTERERKWIGELSANRELIVRNIRLMRLYSYDVTLTKPQVNVAKAYEMMDKFQINSFKRYLETLKEETVNA